MICKYKSAKLNSSKYCYVLLTIQLNISNLFTRLNDQTIQFSLAKTLNGSKYCYVSLTIQLNINHLFTHS